MSANRSAPKRGNVPVEEKHARIPKEDVDVLQYDKLIGKVLVTLTHKYGSRVFSLQEDLVSLGYETLLLAKKKYDPSRGTFVTLAYLRLYTYLDRFLSREFRRQSQVVYSLDTHSSVKNANTGSVFSVPFQVFVDGGLFDMEVFFGWYIGTEKEKPFLALVDGWDERKVVRETGYSYQDFLPQMQEVLDEIMEWCRIWSGGHEIQYNLGDKNGN